MKDKLKYNDKVKTDRDYGIPERWYDFHFKGHDIRISNWLGFEVLDDLKRDYICSDRMLLSFPPGDIGGEDRLNITLSSAVLAMKHNDERFLGSGIHTFRNNGDKNDYSLDNIDTKYEHSLYFDSLEGEEWKQISVGDFEVSNYFRVRNPRSNGQKVLLGRYVRPKFTKYRKSMKRMSDAQLNPVTCEMFNVVVEAMHLFRGIEIDKHARYNFKEPSHNNFGFYHVNDLYLVDSDVVRPHLDELVYDEYDGLYDIPQNEQYQISKDGRLWRKPREVGGKCGTTRMLSGRYIRNSKDGYTFRVNDILTYHGIPLLLYTTFVGEVPEGMYVTYKDGDFRNRRIDNLVLTDKRKRHSYYKRKNK